MFGNEAKLFGFAGNGEANSIFSAGKIDVQGRMGGESGKKQ
jgi:hypothetical protein